MEALPILGTLGAAGINYMGTQSAANSQSNAANKAAQAGLQGTQEGIQLSRDIYNSDLKKQYEAAQYLKGFMPNFDMNMPNPQNYFGQGNVNQFYDLSKSNLNQQYQRSLSEAGMGAGEAAASRGLLNPSLMTRQAQNDVNQVYAPQFTGLEANRAGAMVQNNKDLYQAMLSNGQYANMLRQLGYSNQFNLANNFGSPDSIPTQLPTNSHTNAGSRSRGSGGR